VHHAPLEDGPRIPVGVRRRCRVVRPEDGERFLRPRVVRGEVDEAGVDAEHTSVEGVTEAIRALRDRIEDGLDVRRRTRDDSQNLARGRLLLQGLLLSP
jgi:hypothetical protein